MPSASRAGACQVGCEQDRRRAPCAAPHDPDHLQPAELRHLRVEHGHVDRVDSISSRRLAAAAGGYRVHALRLEELPHRLVPPFLLVGQQDSEPIGFIRLLNHGRTHPRRPQHAGGGWRDYKQGACLARWPLCIAEPVAIPQVTSQPVRRACDGVLPKRTAGSGVLPVWQKHIGVAVNHNCWCGSSIYGGQLAGCAAGLCRVRSERDAAAEQLKPEHRERHLRGAVADHLAVRRGS
jgi:hypothetical protein